MEVNPPDPKHLVPAVDLQMDIGHGWQETPDTVTKTVPATEAATTTSVQASPAAGSSTPWTAIALGATAIPAAALVATLVVLRRRRS